MPEESIDPKLLKKVAPLLEQYLDLRPGTDPAFELPPVFDQLVDEYGRQAVERAISRALIERL